jgi:hypothetical protein
LQRFYVDPRGTLLVLEEAPKNGSDNPDAWAAIGRFLMHEFRKDGGRTKSGLECELRSANDRATRPALRPQKGEHQCVSFLLT